MIIRGKFMVIRAKVKLSQYQVFCFQIRLKATNVDKYKRSESHSVWFAPLSLH